MDVAELEERFEAPGVLGFEKTASGLVLARVTAPAASATVYLHGAHLTDWQPAGHAPVLFLSARTELLPGKAIRGGVPVIFPWFGPRKPGPGHDGTGPSHGFARTSEWELAFAAVAGDEVHLAFTLGPSEVSRGFGFDHFKRLGHFIAGQKCMSLPSENADMGGPRRGPSRGHQDLTVPIHEADR